MKTLEVYDPAMCCATGVCGPQVDPALVQFSADLNWLREQGAEVRRFNLSQNPAAFVENEPVKQALTDKGESALPMLLVDGYVIASGHYPARAILAEALELNGAAASLFTPAVKELVAIGAAVVANCELCLKYHYHQAQLLGVSRADMARAVRTAARVKDSPSQSILRLANRLTGAGVPADDGAGDPCCGPDNTQKSGAATSCCHPTS